MPLRQFNRCDLLEKSYLCGINNNSATFYFSKEAVVICLKSLTFVVSITTTLHEYSIYALL